MKPQPPSFHSARFLSSRPRRPQPQAGRAFRKFLHAMSRWSRDYNLTERKTLAANVRISHYRSPSATDGAGNLESCRIDVV